MASSQRVSSASVIPRCYHDARDGYGDRSGELRATLAATHVQHEGGPDLSRRSAACSSPTSCSTPASPCRPPAVGKEAFDISGREADLGWIGLAEFLPAALLVLVTGSVADRVNRQAGRLGRRRRRAGLVDRPAAVQPRRNPTAVWPMFVIAFFFGVGRAFAAPALRAMPPMVAPEGGLPKVIALFSATWTAAIIFGPAMSGFLYAVDPWVAYAGAAIADLPRLGEHLVRHVRARTGSRRGPDKRPTLHSAMEGLRFIRRTPDPAGGDQPRPVRRAVRWRRRPAPGDRRRPPRRRRHRLRLAARRPGCRRRGDGGHAGDPADPPARRQDAARRRRDLRCSAPSCSG